MAEPMNMAMTKLNATRSKRGADVAPQLAGARLAHHDLDDGPWARQIAARRDERDKLP